MKKLNITKEQFNKSHYFQMKYGKLEYVSESGKVYKTDKGNILKFNENIGYGIPNDELERELKKIEIEDERPTFNDKSGWVYKLYTWKEEVDILRDTLSDLEDDIDISNQEEMISLLKDEKPEYVYFYHSGNDYPLDGEKIENILSSKYNDWDVEQKIWWEDSTESEVGFITMNRKHK